MRNSRFKRPLSLSLIFAYVSSFLGPADLVLMDNWRLSLGVSTAHAQTTPPPAMVDLKAGTNFFAFPRAVTSDADTCFELLTFLGGPNLVVRIARLDALKQTYSACAFDVSGTPTGANFGVRESEGYIVEMRAPATALFSGDITCPELDLEPGVNLVGIPTPPSALGCFDLLESLGEDAASSAERLDSDTARSQICAFDPDDGQLDVAGGLDFPVSAGEGYLIHATKQIDDFQANDPACVQPGTCGDGIRNHPSEQCDGSDAGACSGLCLPDCTCAEPCPTPTITLISPSGGTPGTEVTITGTNLDCGAARSLSCGGVPATVLSASPTQIRTIIPPGADDCQFSITTPGGSATAAGPPFDVEPSRTFAVALTPGTSTALQESSAIYQVSVSGSDGFADLVELGISGLPSGVEAIFFPTHLTAGQSASLTLNVGSAVPVGSYSFSVSGAAEIEGLEESSSATGSLEVLAGGRTALFGQFFLTKGPPLQGVRLTLAGLTAVTDGAGNFAFPDAPAGKHTMSVDASQAARTDGLPIPQPMPMYGVDVTLLENQSVRLPPFQICPPPPEESYTPVEQASSQDQVISDPRFPGASFTIPAGVTIVGWDGVPKEKMGMERLLPDQLPVPPPPGAAKALYQPFFGTPMGGLPSEPIPVTLPNDLELDPGEQADFWYYSAAPFVGVPGEWVKAGSATVSQDGKTVSTDPGVGIERFCGVCGLSCILPRQDQQDNNNPDGDEGGDPVKLGIGQMVVDKTDLVLPGRVPAIVHRVFNGNDPFQRVAGFDWLPGSGWAFSVEWVLQVKSETSLRLVIPGNSRFEFAGQGATFTNTTSPRFAGAVITFDGTAYQLRMKDGTIHHFQASTVPGIHLLASISDRNNNTLRIERNGNLIARITEPGGRSLEFAYSGSRVSEVSDPLGRKVIYGYDGSGRLTTVTDPAGGVTRYDYFLKNGTLRGMADITDARGIKYVRNEYTEGTCPFAFTTDGRPLLTKQTLADGGVWRFEYPGSSITVAGGGGGVVQVSCLPGPISRVITTDPRGNKTTTLIGDKGFTRERIDALGGRTRFEHDQRGNLLSVADAIGRTTSFAYDARANVTKITDAKGHSATIQYDPIFSLPTRIVDPLNSETEMEYDDRGNLLAITDPLEHRTTFQYDASGDLIERVDASGAPTRFAYDATGNLLTTIDALGFRSSYAYDAVSRLTSATDSLGRTWRLDYDALGQVVALVDPANQATLFEYDPNGNPTKVTDAIGQITANRYDAMDRVIERIDPAGRNELFEYDAAGNLTGSRDRKGQQTTLSYDRLNRPTFIAFGDGESLALAYDAAGRMVSLRDSETGTILREYDELDYLTRESSNVGTVDYEYDALGRRMNLIATGQPDTRFSYDEASRLTSIERGGDLVGVTYDSRGFRTRLALPNGVSTHYSHDARGDLSELVYEGPDGRLGNITYRYDAARQRIAMGGTLAAMDLPEPANTSQYAPGNRQIRFGDRQMDFDPNGNLATLNKGAEAFSFVWDARGQLREVNRSSPASAPAAAYARFDYDGAGRRNSKTVVSTESKTTYLYSDADILQEISGHNQIEVLGGPDIDEPLVRGANQYLISDAVGSVVGVTNEHGSLSARTVYEPFGRTRAEVGSAIPYGFTGREQDETGLYYYRARYYAPELARFISEDPIGFAGGDPNLYAYAGCQPIASRDPSGLLAFVPVLIAGAIVASCLYSAFQLGQEIGNALSGRKVDLRDAGFAALGVAGCAYGSGFIGGFSQTALRNFATNSRFGGYLFGRSTGLFNNNPWVRIGLGWKGNAKTGQEVFRLVIGNRRLPIHWHWP